MSPSSRSASHGDGVTVIPDVPFAAPGGHSLFADIHRPPDAAGPVPAILWIHGGGWRAGNRRVAPDLSRFFAASGFAMIAIDYRLSRRAVFPAQIEDVKSAIRWVRSVAATYHIDAARIGLWGASSGGHLAALAGLTGDDRFTPADTAHREHSSAVQAVVDGYGPTDFLQMDAHRPPAGRPSDDPESLLLPRPEMRSADADSYESRLLGAPIGTRPDRVRDASPLTYAGVGAPPFLIVHGLSDTTVAPHQSEILFDALARHGNDVTLARIDGLGHGFFNRTALDDGGARQIRIETASGGTRGSTRIEALVFSLVEAFFKRVLIPA